MGFDHLQWANGPIYLSPGGSVRLEMRFGRGDDHGAQWIMAHPLRNGQPPTELVVSDFSKILDYDIGVLTENGAPQYSYDRSSSYYRYGVTVTNKGASGTQFYLQGGGNT